MDNSLDKDTSKGQIVKTLIHEIRSPLFNIKSFLETLYEYHFQLSDRQILEFLEIANQETNRLVRLTNSSLEVSRLNSRITLFNPFSIQDITSKVVQSYEITALSKSINLYYKSKIKLPKIKGNYDLIFQVLTNLLTNSIKFTYPKGILILKVKKISSLSLKNRKKTTGLRIDVIDTGVGLSLKNKNDLLNKCKFNKYKKIHVKNNSIEGTGVGISIVTEILDKHNKSSSLVSNINKGTNTFFTL
jgi:two-component system, OmpR family, sensor histidine kinase NblS